MATKSIGSKRTVRLAGGVLVGVLTAAAVTPPGRVSSGWSAGSITVRMAPQQATAEPTLPAPTLSVTVPASPPAPSPALSPTSSPSATTGLPATAIATATATTLPTPTSMPPRDGAATSEASSSGLPREERPIVVLRDFSVEPSRPAAGASCTLRVLLANVGEHLAENVRLSLSSSVFLPAAAGSMPFVNRLDEGDSVELRLPLKVAAGTADGPQSLEIVLSWDDSYGGTYSDKTTIGIEVAGSASRPVVAIGAVRLPGRVVPGTIFELYLDLVNIGQREAQNVTVVLSGPPLAVIGGRSLGPLSIAPGGNAQVVLRVMAGALSQPGPAAQTLELRYSGPDGERYSETENVGLMVSGSAVAAPMPLVESYRVEPEELHPGETFRLKLTILNVGSLAAEQMRLVIGGPGGQSGTALGASGGAAGASTSVFAPLGAGNVRFLGRLAAAERREVEQAMVVASGAKPGVQTLALGLVYLDSFGQVVQDSQEITLLVSRRVRLEIHPVDVVTSTFVGQPLPLTVEIVNLGSEEVNVTTAEIRPGRYMTREGGVEYIGPLSTGAPYPVTANLVPRAPTKDAVVTIVIHYLDDFGREQSVQKELHFEVSQAPPIEEAGPSPAAAAGRGMIQRVLWGLLGLGASPSLQLPKGGAGGLAPAGGKPAPVAPQPSGGAGSANEELAPVSGPPSGAEVDVQEERAKPVPTPPPARAP